MYRLEEEFKKGLVERLQNSRRMRKVTEINKGIEALEKLAAIEIDNDGFGERALQRLCEYNIGDEGALLRDINFLESFFSKLFEVTGTVVESTTLFPYYEKIGFLDWSRKEDVMRARDKDRRRDGSYVNSRNYMGFNINECNADYFLNCSNNFYDYIIAYKYRNGVIHSEGEINAEDQPSKKQIYVSVWAVYLTQCYKNAEVIEEKYYAQQTDDLLEQIDFAEFAEERLSEIGESDREVLEDYFIQLDWVASCGELKKSTKFIGEAGAGKTTQMMKKYYDELNAVADGDNRVKSLPIWVKLIRYNGREQRTILQIICDVVDRTEEDIEVLLKGGFISLYLDGYNEVLMTGTETQKKALADEINDLQKTYPELVIYMTDRVRNSVPRCLSEGVRILICNKMNLSQVLQYSDKRTAADEEIHNTIEKLDWVEKAVYTPLRAESLVEMIQNGRVPANEADFYKMYIHYLLQRERGQKDDLRADIIPLLLNKLALEMLSSNDAITVTKTLELWMKTNVKCELEKVLLLTVEMSFLERTDSKFDEPTVKFSNPYYYTYFKNLD